MNRLPLSLWEQWLNSPGAMRLGSALLHFVWQGALLAGITWLLLVVLKRTKPQIRYAVLLATFAALAACPVVTYLVVDVDFANVAESGSQYEQTPSLSEVAATPAAALSLGTSKASEEMTAGTPSHGLPAPVNSHLNASLLQHPESAELSWSRRLTVAGAWLHHHRHWVVAFWLAGVCLVSMRLVAGLIGAERARRLGATAALGPVQQIVARLAARLNIRRTVRVLESALAEAPALVGWLRPVILLPTSALIGLTPLQLEAILAHELAHVLRHDYLVNLLQTVIETILFYHPAVWWISRRIRQEREHCCDDLAIAICADRVAYARALTAMEELCAAPARWIVAARGGSLVERIRRIVGRPEPAGSGKPALAAIAAVLMFVAGVTIQLRQTVSAGDAAANATTAAGDEQKAKPSAAQDAAKKTAMRRVVGRVVDDQGKPVANANLYWQVMYTADGKDESIQGTSDSNGEFQLVAPVASKPEFPSQRSDMLWVLARGKCLAVVRAKGESAKNEAGTDDKAGKLEIRLEPATDTAFAVFDHTGTPLAGALVEPMHFRSPQGYGIIPEAIRKLLQVTSDKSGKVRMPEMSRKGFFSVQVTSEPFGIQNLRLDPRASAPAERLLTLRETGRIEGRLIADKPEWVRGIKLSFETTPAFREPAEGQAFDSEGLARAVTDEEGRFVVPAVASGELRIYVHMTSDSPVLPKQPDNVQLASGETTELEIPLVDTVLARGSVLTEDMQAPVPGAEISVRYGVQRQGGRAVTDRDGRYEVRVLPGAVYTQIIVMPNDFGERYVQVGSPWDERQQVPADVKDFELAPIVLSPVTTVEGKLLDHRGRPLANVQINGVHQNRRYGHSQTNDQGRFLIKSPRKITLESYEVWLDDGQTRHVPSIEQDDPLILKLETPPGSEAENADKIKEKEPAEKRTPPEKAASDARRPWSVHGHITDAEGKPMVGVVVTAHTGMGTLRETGKAETDAAGKYAFDFGPGILLDKDTGQLQAATIAARKPGFSEKNLSRQGDLRAALKLPEENATTEKQDTKNIILPGQPRQIDFVMVPAAKIAGTLIDKDAALLVGYSISLTGDELPPSSSAVAATKTDEQGRFALSDIPTGFKWQFLVEPAKRQPPWNAWASGMFVFRADAGDNAVTIQQEGHDLAANRFEIQIFGEGLNWKEAIKAGDSHQRMDITGYSLKNKSRVQAAAARLVLAMPGDSGSGDTQASAAVTPPPGKGSPKTNLKRTRPDNEGHFSVTFDNPLTKPGTQRWTLDPEKHQVIFQIFVKDANGKLVEKIFKQLAARETGGYRVDVQVKPELIDTSTISITFVTIQPEHDQWVKAFFHEGKGTSYKGLWSGDGGKLSAMTVD